MSTTITQTSLIETLNATARKLDTGDAWDALKAAARAHDLTEVVEDGSCILYRAADGALINCWIDGPQSQGIGEGGLGFDDQVSWYTEREENEGEADA